MFCKVKDIKRYVIVSSRLVVILIILMLNAFAWVIEMKYNAAIHLNVCKEVFMLNLILGDSV